MKNKFIIAKAKLKTTKEKEPSFKKELVEKLEQCHCRWCKTKIESPCIWEKIKCKKCGWLLWKYNVVMIDYKWKDWIPQIYYVLNCIDVEWPNIEEYYNRGDWGYRKFSKLETEQYSIEDALKESKKEDEWMQGTWSEKLVIT